MDFGTVTTSLGQQLKVIAEAPAPFIACVLIAGFVIWRFMERQYRLTIEGMEHRIRLRDDTITHLEKSDSHGDVVRMPTSDLMPASPSSVTAVSIPIKPARKRDSKASRVFIADSVTPRYFHSIFEKMTDVQAVKVVEPYVGKWMKIEGFVSNVSKYRESMTVALKGSKDYLGEDSISTDWLRFTKDHDRLETLRPGDKITAIGRIDRIEAYAVRLEDCELLKAE